MDWQTLIRQLCDVRDGLGITYAVEPGHVIFDALDRARPGMSKDDAQFIANVIGYYREQLDVRAWAAETAVSP